jgi:hypothetical protein
MGLHHHECKAKNKHNQETRVKKDLLPVTSKESMGGIYKAIPALSKGSMGILL